MPIYDSDITERQADELDRLFCVCFGGMAFRSGPKADARAVWTENGAIVAHTAIGVRRIDLHGSPTRAALLGLVCVDPLYRGKGIGHRLIAELQRATALPFVLNCGYALVAYYSRIGYLTIADAATYDRGNAVTLDRDPVMGHANGQPIQMALQAMPIHLGTDF